MMFALANLYLAVKYCLMARFGLPNNNSAVINDVNLPGTIVKQEKTAESASARIICNVFVLFDMLYSTALDNTGCRGTFDNGRLYKSADNFIASTPNTLQ